MNLRKTYSNVSIQSYNNPPGIPRAFDTFAVHRWREFDNRILLRGGEINEITYKNGPMGHLNGFLARGEGNLRKKNFFQISQMPGGMPEGLPGGC